MSVKKTIVPLLLLCAALLIAGGPVEYLPDGRGLKQDPSRPFVFHVESGNLTTAYNNEVVNRFTNEGFATWNAVPGSTLQIQAGAQDPEDIATLAQLNAAIAAGRNTIVFDEDGALFEEFGSDSQVLAFASHTTARSEYLGVGFVIFGGPAMSSFQDQGVRRIMIHEFGHLLGLGHSIVNGDLDSSGQQYESFGRAPANTVEIMYWVVSNGSRTALQTGLTRDDMSAFLALYGTHAQGGAGMSAVSGRVVMPDGGSPADGVNVIARDRSGGSDTVFQNAASRIATPGTGTYDIGLLPPGQYSVEVRDISESSNGAYSPPIRSDRQVPGNRVIGEFPGLTEFYNGADESSDPNTDDPSTMALVTTVADQTTPGIDIIFNRLLGSTVRGTGLTHVNTVAEVRNAADGSEQTWLGVVNSRGVPVYIDVYGFNDSGEVIARAADLTSIPAFGKLWVNSAEVFGSAASEVTWIQIGSTVPLVVYAEIQNATVRSAYLAADSRNTRTFMPHIAVDTTNFETVLSSVNVGDNAAVTSITRQPNGDAAGIDGLNLAYGRESRAIQDYFPELGSDQIWAEINSSQASVSAMEYFTRLPNRSQFASLGLNDQSSNTLQFLHVATDTGQFWTGMVYINVGTGAATITETYYDASGNVIRSSQQPPLDAGGKITLLFDANNQDRVPAGTSWVEVSGDQPLIGYELFGTPVTSANDTFTGLQGNTQGGQELIYPHFQMQGTTFTALVATNLGDSAANIVFEAMSADGRVLQRSAAMAVNAKSKFTAVLDGLFPNADTLSNGAWIRAVADGSTWAGFTLWGDHLVPERNYLSGITAQSSAQTSGNLIMETSEPHNTFATAQVLRKSGDQWNINVVGNLDEAGTSPVNVYGNGFSDDFEDIYTFTLDEPTALVIGVAPNNSTVDLDLIVTNGPYESFSFYNVSDNNSFSNSMFSATATGDENVARVFPAGTYFILVSYFDGTGTPATDYGLVVTEAPLLFETFDAGTVPPGWSTLQFTDDADGQSNWTGSTEFGSTLFGNGLKNDSLATPGVEQTGIVSPPFNVPADGVTLFGFEVLWGSEGANAATATVGVGTVIDGQFSQVDTGIAFQTSTIATAYRDTTLNASFWWPYTNAKQGNRAGLSLTPGLQNTSLAIFTQLTNNVLHLDNVRVFHIQTTMSGKSRKGGMVLAPSGSPKYGTAVLAPANLEVVPQP
ncbi:hypothetical protein [Acanthopleuribacter pedis]|uniref:Peptidase metallopeptidase domain-containing protein n=1 Tax=Acanthopleuribacter pedis TaxID=442870 RepID=A0A8J7QFB5_9BACT|nr:hypothetical protein [Acanthopleuribacter pedis]MBO1318800.1 hypothetical protein [Acanthopleuribacter pedis]